MDVIEAYIDTFSKETQTKLREVKQVIERYVPKETTTTISWGMPTYVYQGHLVHFAGFKHHVGFFIGSGDMHLFKDLATQYTCNKSGFHIGFDQEVPESLIETIIAYRVKENEMIQQAKAAKKKSKNIKET